MAIEYREVRASVGIDNEGKLHGVALPFNSRTVIGDLKRGGWHEEVSPGACKKSIAEGDVVFLAHHDMHMPLARTSAGNLALREEGDKLAWEATPVDTSYGRDIRKLAEAKVLGGVSIGFQPIKEEWRDSEGRPSDKHTGTHRILRELKPIEISAVTNPAYKETSIMARDELLAEREELADERASSVSAASRRKLASKGNALPDGSYPIPDVAHLHAAAVLAASKHGNYKAARRLIKRRAKDLGVDVKTLPGFGNKISRSAYMCPDCQRHDCPVVTAEHRDDPDGKEYACIDEALRQIHAGDIAGAKKTLAANQKQRGKEPGSSTPDGERSQALTPEMRIRMLSRKREFEFEAETTSNEGNPA